MRNLTTLTDLYELTMVGGYFVTGKKDQCANFDYFFRKVPDDGGFCIAAGLQQLIEHIENIRFTEDDIAYIETLRIFPAEVLDYFRRLRFTGDLYAVPEGTIIFPNEPIIRVTAPLPEAQFIESALLNIMNFQTLIATKAARICIAAEGNPVIEFGLRRAHGPDAALGAARASFIGGAMGTSNLLAGKTLGIPVRGTIAHSWIESFPSELEAFRTYAKVYPQNCLLLVDTYNTLRSGVPNAIKVGRELRDNGKGQLIGIRLDSGDLAYLSRQSRRMLDENGFDQTKIIASSDLDEWLVESLKKQEAKIDIWGVGTRLVTSYSCPALGGVYKLTAITENGKMAPKIKRSDNPEKITNPGVKRLVRYHDETGMMRGDVLFLEDESPDPDEPTRAFHPVFPHIYKTYPSNFERQELFFPVFINGKRVYDTPPLGEIQENTKRNLDRLGSEFKRFQNPHVYHLSLSEKLFRVKQELLMNAY
ncbi:MAG: nicotinate phosphoribosyltransferase [Thermodesulfobacteriota bacterium]